MTLLIHFKSSFIFQVGELNVTEKKCRSVPQDIEPIRVYGNSLVSFSSNFFEHRRDWRDSIDIDDNPDLNSNEVYLVVLCAYWLKTSSDVGPECKMMPDPEIYCVSVDLSDKWETIVPSFWCNRITVESTEWALHRWYKVVQRLKTMQDIGVVKPIWVSVCRGHYPP